MALKPLFLTYILNYNYKANFKFVLLVRSFARCPNLLISFFLLINFYCNLVCGSTLKLSVFLFSNFLSTLAINFDLEHPPFRRLDATFLSNVIALWLCLLKQLYHLDLILPTLISNSLSIGHTQAFYYSKLGQLCLIRVLIQLLFYFKPLLSSHLIFAGQNLTNFISYHSLIALFRS